MKLIARFSPETILGTFVLGFGLWTLGNNLAIALRGSLFLAAIFTAVFAISLTVLWKKLPSQNQAASEKFPESEWIGPRLNARLIIGALVVLLGWILTRHYWVFWLGGLGLITVFLVKARASAPFLYGPAKPSPTGLTSTWLLVLACSALAFLAIRPDADDAHYLNRAAYVAGNFFKPLPEHYTIFPGEHIPYPPVFSFHVYHDFVGLLSKVSGLEPLEVSAFLLTPILASLVVLAYAVLFRTLFPTAWPWALAAVVALLLIDGTSHVFFSNFAFVRIWQGKCVLLHLLAPALIAYALWFGSTGGLRNLIRLALAEIAAFGLSPIAIWLAPILALTGILAGGWGQKSLLQRLAGGLLASLYPLARGALVYFQFQQEQAPYRDLTAGGPGDLFLRYCGSFQAVAVWLGVILLAPLLTAERKMAWFCAVYAFVYLLIFGNPLLAPFVFKHMAPGTVAWRTLWLIPLPAMAAAILCSGIRSGMNRTTMVGPLLLVLLIGGYGLLIPKTYVLSPKNRVSFRWSAVKAGQAEYALAKFLARHLPSGSNVIAPTEVAWILPTLRKTLYSVMPKVNVVKHTILIRLGRQKEFNRRMFTAHFANGITFTYGNRTGGLPSATLQFLIRDFDVQAVVTVKSLPDFERVNQTLNQMGFTYYNRYGFHVWLK